MYSQRRQFERLEISEEAVALDDNGRRLGTVTSAGGGGMTIVLNREIAATFTAGARLRVIVEEPSTGVRHTLPVEVKYCQDGQLGVEFVSSL